MRWTASPSLLLVSALLVGCQFRTSEEAAWIHFHVVEHGGDDVKISLPWAVVRTTFKLVPEAAVHLEETDASAAELGRHWQALKASGEEERVVTEGEELIRLVRGNDRAQFIVEDRRSGAVIARIETRTDMVDALLKGGGSDLDLKAALSGLGPETRGELLLVEDQDSTVRIWIDEPEWAA